MNPSRNSRIYEAIPILAGRSIVKGELTIVVILLVNMFLGACVSDTRDVSQVPTEPLATKTVTGSAIEGNDAAVVADARNEDITTEAVAAGSGSNASEDAGQGGFGTNARGAAPRPTLVPHPDGYDLASGAIKLEPLKGPAPSFVKQQLSSGPGGGGQGANDFRVCDALNLRPDQDLKQPFIVQNASMLRTRSFVLGSYVDSADVCACGYDYDDVVSIEMVSPSGAILFQDTARPALVRRNDKLLTYCLQLTNLSSFDFVPGDPLGTYTVRLINDRATLEHEFELVQSDRPTLFYSSRLKGYILVGFQPHERLVVLHLQGSNLVSMQQVTLDEYGTALLVASQRAEQIGSLVVLSNGHRLFVEGIASIPPLLDRSALVNGALAQYPESPIKHYLIGTTSGLSRAIALAEDPGDAYAARAAIQLRKTDAVRDLSVALDYDATNLTYLATRAETLESLGDLDAAVEDLRMLVMLSRVPMNPLNDLLRIHTRLRDHPAMVEDLSQMIDIEPGNPSLYLARARLQVELGEFVKAHTDYSVAITLTDDSWLNRAQSFFERGEALKAMGELDKAIADYETALALTGDDGLRNDVYQALQNIRLELSMPVPPIDPGATSPTPIPFPSSQDLPEVLVEDAPLMTWPSDILSVYQYVISQTPSYVQRQAIFLEPDSNPLLAEGIDWQGCYRYELDPAKSYDRPIILEHASLLSRRSYLAPNEGPDVCACGFKESDRVKISLLDRAGIPIGLDNHTVTPYPVSRGPSDETVYCVAVREIATRDFPPQLRPGWHQIVISTGATQIEHPFLVVAPDEPTLWPFDKNRPPSLALVGLDPSEVARWLKYEVWFYPSSEYSGQGRLIGSGTITVDERGRAFVPNTHTDYFDDYASSVTYIVGSRGLFTSYGGRMADGQLPVDFDLMVVEEPSNPTGYYLRATMPSDRDTVSRIADLTQAIALMPHRAEFYYERGKLQNNLSLAVADFSDAIVRAPARAPYYSERGQVLAQLQQFELAERDFDRAAELTYDPMNLYYDMLRIHQTAGYHAGTANVLTKMIERQPGQGLFYLRRGQAYMAGGNWERAVTDFTFALDFADTLGIDPATALLERAQANILASEDDRAAADLQQVLVITSDETLKARARNIMANLNQ